LGRGGARGGGEVRIDGEERERGEEGRERWDGREREGGGCSQMQPAVATRRFTAGLKLVFTL